MPACDHFARFRLIRSSFGVGSGFAVGSGDGVMRRRRASGLAAPVRSEGLGLVVAIAPEPQPEIRIGERERDDREREERDRAAELQHARSDARPARGFHAERCAATYEPAAASSARIAPELLAVGRDPGRALVGAAARRPSRGSSRRSASGPCARRRPGRPPRP